MTRKVREYNALAINVDDPMEHVRRRPGMYVGDTDKNGTFQCYVEVVQNATDEMREIGGGKVAIRIHNDAVLVADEGRGIPIEIHPKTGVSTLETILTRIGAGGKVGSSNSAYGSRTIGVHGVGVSAVCALSQEMSVWTFRKGRWWRLDTSCGKVVGQLRQDPPPLKWSKGTIVRYKVDTTILPEPLDLANARHYCHIARHFDQITIDYADDEKSAVLEPRPPQQLLKRALLQSSVLLGPFDFNVDGVRAVVAWVNEPDYSIQAHVAGAPVPNGTHVKGLEEAIAAAFTKARPRDSKNVDSTVGLRAVLDVTVDQPSFSGQAKFTLRTASVRGQVVSALAPVLAKALKTHSAELSVMIEYASQITAIDVKHKDQRELAKETKTTRGVLSFPKGFMAALSAAPNIRETFIVEGDSSAGSCKLAKLPYQEVLPLYGKMANIVAKQSAAKTNERIGGILRVLGHDLNKKDHPFRTGKVVLLADADEDGSHISVLLMSLFWEVVPRLVSEGRLYLVDAPLFEAMTSRGERVMGSNLAVMTREHGKLIKVNRMKGWGGATVPLLRKFAFEPSTRQLLQLQPPNLQDSKGLRDLMGADASTRKDLLRLEDSK